VSDNTVAPEAVSPNELKSVWHRYFGGEPPAFDHEELATEPPATAATEEDAPVAVSLEVLEAKGPVAAFGPPAKLRGCQFKGGGVESVVVWGTIASDEPVALGKFLPPDFRTTAGSSLILKCLGVRKANWILGSDGVAELPRLPALKNPKDLEDLSMLVDWGIVSPCVTDWAGLSFQGDLCLNLPNGINGTDLPASAKELLDKVIGASVPLTGSFQVDEEEKLLCVELAWSKDGSQSFSLRPGSDWDLTLKSFVVRGTCRERSRNLDWVEADSILTLGGHRVGLKAQIDLRGKTVSLDVQPHWAIDLGWIESFGGKEEFAKGGGSLLADSAGSKPPALMVKRIYGQIGWEPSLGARALSLTVGSPGPADGYADWSVLGGKLRADLSVHWVKPVGGESRFDCEINGTWEWEKLRFAAALDTRSGEFEAHFDFGEKKDLDEFAKNKLFPGTTPATTANEAPASTTRLNEPFEIATFDISGNYREKRIEAELETTGFFGFRLVGKNDDDRNRVDVRIGDLSCAASYDLSGSEGADWSVQVGGTFGLLRGGEPAALGEGARVEGTFSKDKTELTLKIEEFKLDELVGMLLAEDPPAALKGKPAQIDLLYRAGEKFSLKCVSDFPLFKSVRLKGLELDIVSAKKKPAQPETNGQPAKKPVNSGKAKIGFGKDLVVEVEVRFEPEQLKLIGSARKIDVSEIIDGFFKPDGAEKAPALADEEKKKSGRIIAKEISVELWMAREASKDPERAKEENSPAPTAGDDKLKIGNSLTVTIQLERGESTVTLVLIAMGEKLEDGKVEWRILFAGDVNLKASSLPLVGDILGKEADKFAVALHTLYLDTEKTKDGKTQAGKAKDKVAGELFKRSTNIDKAWKKDGKPDKDLQNGWNVKADFATAKLITVNASLAEIPASETTAKAEEKKVEVLEPAALTGPKDQLTWKDQKLTVGPIQLNRVGYGVVEDGAKKTGVIALDAALDLGALRLAVIGLGMEVDIPSFAVTPRLEGLGINMRNGPIEITGALTYKKGVYSGIAQVKTAKMTLGAIGRFSMQDSKPSFFLYCVYAGALGGPPEFYIEGLAGGVGYATRIVLPALEDVPGFALVKAAREGLGSKPEETLASFDKSIVAEPNNLWIAAGLRFSTYKMLDSTVVVALSIGDDIEVDLFGHMALRAPLQIPGKDLPLIASVDLAIRGKIAPARGEFWIRGQILPGSFIFDKACQLTGGFAFQIWFLGDLKGDFVATVGGYHPDFQKPAHYFDVPRFGIQWQLTKELSIKGGAYLAITSRAIMVGGRLEMLYEGGSVKASFIAEAHFLVAWAPLRYMADIRISVDASFTISVLGWEKEFNVHVAAALHLEGPPFKGYAKLELGPITVTIGFGKDEEAKPLAWSEVQKQFLPETKAVISLRSTNISAPENAPRREADYKGRKVMRTTWVLIPGKAWEIAIESAVPPTSLVAGKDDVVELVQKKQLVHSPARNITKSFGVAPMRATVVSSAVSIKLVTKNGQPVAEDIDWKAAMDEALHMDTALDFIEAPVAPALWDDKFPDPKAATDPKKDPRLNPPSVKDSNFAVTGVILKSRPLAQPTIKPDPKNLQEPKDSSVPVYPLQQPKPLATAPLTDACLADLADTCLRA